MTTPTDLAGKPYKPTLDYGWMTDAHRATCALHMACDPSQIEYRLDARAKMDKLHAAYRSRVSDIELADWLDARGLTNIVRNAA